MIRPFTFFKDCYRRRDWAAGLLAMAIFATAVAALSVLFLKPMRVASLKRFHLASDSYGLWAIHQFVPSMYNFENKIMFSNQATSLDEISPQDPTLIYRTLNHFPARHVTFGHFRQKHFSEYDHGTFWMVSTFQDQRLISTWKIDKRDDTLWVTRVQQELLESSDQDER